jgi:hypothetical protein
MDGAADCERQGLYVLDGETPRPARSMREWAAQQEDLDARRVGYWVHLETLDGPPVASVSTVFLGEDLAFGQDLLPLCFESLVEWPPSPAVADRAPLVVRYYTWAEAEAGHAYLVQIVQVCLRVAARAGQRPAPTPDRSGRCAQRP